VKTRPCTLLLGVLIAIACSGLVPLAPLLYSPPVADAGPLVGTNIPISTAAFSQRIPVVGVDPTSGRYLVAYVSSVTVPASVRGQFVNEDGTLHGSEFVIVSGGPEMAFSESRSQFLVVGGPGFGLCELPCTRAIIGQFVNSDGPVGGILDTVRFSVCVDCLIGRPVVVWNRSTRQYLIVWSDNHLGTRDVFARLVNDDGTLAGAVFPVSTEAGDQSAPSVAVNSAVNEFLIIWEDSRNSATSGIDLFGQRVGADGTLMGDAFEISTVSGNQRSPVSAFIPTDDQYFVLWQDDRNLGATGWDLYGQIVNADGTLKESEYALSLSAGHQQSPAIACVSNQPCLVVWKDDRNGIFDVFGVFAGSDGMPVSAEFRITDVSSSSGGSPRSAYNQSTMQWLVAWNDSRDGNDDIFGQLAEGPTFGFLRFPLLGLTAYTALINTVFDHSVPNGFYGKRCDVPDKRVVAFTGAVGQSCAQGDVDPCRSAFHYKCSYGYTSDSGGVFVLDGARYSGGRYLFYDGHPGYDYNASLRTKIYAPAAGMVVVPKVDPINGPPQQFNTITIDHGNGYSTWYLHNSKLRKPEAAGTSEEDYVASLPTGTTYFVRKGEPIGEVGCTGVQGCNKDGRGSHLHFEVRKGGIPVDPYGWEGSGPDPYTMERNIRLWE